MLLIPAQASAAAYVVRPGDTLSSIAARSHVTVFSLARANGITNPNVIQIGRTITIPDPSLHPLYYRVRWGDTLSGIAARFGVSFASLRALNPQLGQYLLAGSSLRICRACTRSSTPISAAASDPAPGTSGNRYLIQPGETLWGIASRFGVSPATIVAANHLVDPGHILAGFWLTIPGATSPLSTSTSSPGSSSPWTARSLIQTWSRTYGISASLPLAIAWQESGFNQAMVSPTGAIGVMQVEPYTADVIARYLGHPVDLNDLDQNIQAGVFWLTHLLVQFGWNEQMAVAAYYQGAPSIAVYGLFTDTTQYVNNVLALQSRFAS